MQSFFNRVFAWLFGDPRLASLEQRLFTTISLLNAVANFGGAFTLIFFRHNVFLCLLHLGTGLAFLAFYFLARARGVYRPLYWPFVALIVIFLFVNSLEDAGTSGASHYYLIPGLVIATILSGRARNTVIALALFGLATAALFYVERTYPHLVIPHPQPELKWLEVLFSLLFVQVFTGALVLVLTHNLNQERRKSDGLLLNILPDSIAQELKMRDQVRPRQYESATVMFTDFVGFTRLAESLSPGELIEELDACFRQFDAIIRKHNVEKIKTIGDAYMAVGGIPMANATNAVDCVLAGLEIQQLMTDMQRHKAAAGLPYWRLRLGIHTGRLVAGVIGQEKFAYDVWGDTVNTASRLESSGVADRVNISADTYGRVKDFFACEYRGKIPAKNKGEIVMYFVNGIRPELSVGGEGREPNGQFAALYQELSASVPPARTTLPRLSVLKTR